ncbi:MAG: efflux RND transporter periplasmic adaptor subunit [Pseudomonadota bacterium]
MKWTTMAALACGVLWAGDAPAQEAAPRPAKVFTVSATEDVVRRTYPAIVLPSREVELSFRVSGRVVELPIRGAMQVQEGDVIARVDPRDFETQIAQIESQIAQAAAELSALRAGARVEEVAALEAAVSSAEAQLEQAQDAVDRTRQLAERGVVANAQLETAEAEFRVAEANLRTQQEQLRIGQSGGRPEDIEAAEAAIRGLDAQLQVARDNLDDATLRAPFDGIIARRDIENFVNIQAGQSVAVLQALEIVHLAYDVPGPDVTDLTRNGPQAIETVAMFDAIPGETFEAEVVEFSVQADSATQTYRGRVAVVVPQGAFILPGMVASVVASAPGMRQNLMAPLSAVAAAADGSTFMWVVDDAGAVAARPVTLGEAAGEMVIVTNGLAEGDTVVSAGVSRIIDGMTIRPITQVGN